MNFIYFFCPLVTWLATGALKFALNWLFHGGEAFARIGPGGIPSNHTAVVTSTVTVIALNQGLEEPVTGLGVAVILIVIFDAISLRRQVGLHASHLNSILDQQGYAPLRDRIGHSKWEILAGLAWGVVFGWFYSWSYNSLFTLPA